MNNETTAGKNMLEAKKILHAHGYICQTTGLNFRITTPFGIKSFETLTGLIELSRKLTQIIL